MFRAYLSPVTTTVGALITMLTLVLAVRAGQAEIVAAYTAGVSIGAFVSVIAAGGSTLAFITGDTATQHAVRSIRLKFVLPVVTGSILIFSLPYAALSSLDLVGVLLGGLAISFNTLAELETGYLKRQVNTPALLGAETSSRLLGLVAVIAGTNFALAMLLVAFARFSLLWYHARQDPSRSYTSQSTLKHKLKIAYRPSLMISSLMYVIIDRTLFLLVPFMVSGTVAGYFAAMLSAQQAVAGALASGLQTSMAARSESRTQTTGTDARTWFLKFELSLIGLATLAALLGLLLHRPLMGLLGVPSQTVTVAMWAIILCSMPIAISARAVQYVLLSRENRIAVLVSTSVGALTLAVLSLVALINMEVMVALFALPIAESAALVAALLRGRPRSLPANKPKPVP